jgi:hypothetical protein
MGVPTSEAVTFRPQPGGETMKSIRIMWHWENEKSFFNCAVDKIVKKNTAELDMP